MVITIVVLLILAGVSIAMLTGDNGILERTYQAKGETGQAQLEEEVRLKMQEKEIGKYQENPKSVEQLLGEIEGTTVEKIQEETWYVTREGYGVTVYEDGEIKTGKIDIWDGKKVAVPDIQENNWSISSCAELKFLADFTNNANVLTEEQKRLVAEKNYDEKDIVITENTIIYLNTDLDFGARPENENWETETNEKVKWTSIGKTKETALKATFEGNNHIIRGLYVNDSTPGNGIFGNSSSIKNVTIKNSYIKGGKGTAGIVGYLRNGKVENCHNIDTTVTLLEGDYTTVAGVVGQMDKMTEINNSSNTGTVNAYGISSSSTASNCGGIVGISAANVKIYNSKNEGKINGNGGGVGGIIGNINSNSEISNCYNQGKVIGKGERIGGIVGNGTSSTIIKECKNTGEIVGENTLVGGIAGINLGNIEKSENAGQVIGKGERVGGITGNSNPSTIIKECKNTGEIVGENTFVGGIAGISYGNIEKSENAGQVIGKGERVGGIVGNSAPSTIIKECKNAGEILGEDNNVGGIAGIGFSNIENCHNIGKITGKGAVGGILGQIGIDAKSNIINCSNEGNIEATGIYQNTDIAIGGIIGWTSATGTSGKIENVYNKGKVISKATGRGIGGIIGRNSNTFELINCYNKGIVEGKEGIGSIIGIQTGNNNDNVSNSYYLNTLGIKAINNADDPSKNIIGVSDDINDYEQFINWITTK